MYLTEEQKKELRFIGVIIGEEDGKYFIESGMNSEDAVFISDELAKNIIRLIEYKKSKAKDIIKYAEIHENRNKEFKEIVKPVIKWLNEAQAKGYTDPHMKIIISGTTAELVGGEIAFNTDEFLID